MLHSFLKKLFPKKNTPNNTTQISDRSSVVPFLNIQNDNFINLFQKELYLVVLNQISFFPTKIDQASLIASGKMCCSIALTNKKFYSYLKNTLTDLYRMYFLYSKYSKYNDEYEHPEKTFIYITGYNFECPPTLIDAMNSGNNRLPFAKHSSETVNFGDIMEIMRLMPQSIQSNIGQLRCREYVTPFVAAVFNDKITEDILIYLIQHGCDPHTKYKLNNYEIDLLEDIKTDNESRYDLLISAMSKCSK